MNAGLDLALFPFLLFSLSLVCMCVCVCVCLHGHVCAVAHVWRAEDHSTCQASPSTLFETRSLVHHYIIQASCLGASREFSSLPSISLLGHWHDRYAQPGQVLCGFWTHIPIVQARTDPESHLLSSKCHCIVWGKMKHNCNSFQKMHSYLPTALFWIWKNL